MTAGLLGSSIVWFREGFEIWLILQMTFLLISNNRQKIVLLTSSFLGSYHFSFNSWCFSQRIC